MFYFIIQIEVKRPNMNTTNVKYTFDYNNYTIKWNNGLPTCKNDKTII